MTTNGTLQPSPISNARVEIHATKGRWPVVIVVDGPSLHNLLDKVDAIQQALTKRGYAPVADGGVGAVAAAPASEEAPICAIHKTPMSKRNGKNGSFWSCAQKLEDGSWCPYKPKK